MLQDETGFHNNQGAERCERMSIVKSGRGIYNYIIIPPLPIITVAVAD